MTRCTSIATAAALACLVWLIVQRSPDGDHDLTFTISSAARLNTLAPSFFRGPAAPALPVEESGPKVNLAVSNGSATTAVPTTPALRGPSAWPTRLERIRKEVRRRGAEAVTLAASSLAALPLIVFNRVPKAGSTTMLHLMRALNRRRAGHNNTGATVELVVFSSLNYYCPSMAGDPVFVEAVLKAAAVAAQACEANRTRGVIVVYVNHVYYEDMPLVATMAAALHNVSSVQRWQRRVDAWVAGDRRLPAVRLNFLRSPVDLHVSRYYYNLYVSPRNYTRARYRDRLVRCLRIAYGPSEYTGDRTIRPRRMALTPTEVRALALPDINQLARRFPLCLHETAPFAWFLGGRGPANATVGEAETRALARLVDGFTLVGLLEQLPLSLALLERLLPTAFGGISYELTVMQAAFINAATHDPRYVRATNVTKRLIAENPASEVWYAGRVYAAAAAVLSERRLVLGVSVPGGVNTTTA